MSATPTIVPATVVPGQHVLGEKQAVVGVSVVAAATVAGGVRLHHLGSARLSTARTAATVAWMRFFMEALGAATRARVRIGFVVGRGCLVDATRGTVRVGFVVGRGCLLEAGQGGCTGAWSCVLTDRVVGRG